MCYDNHGQTPRDDASECFEEVSGGYGALVNFYHQPAGFGIDTLGFPDSAGLGYESAPPAGAGGECADTYNVEAAQRDHLRRRRLVR